MPPARTLQTADLLCERGRLANGGFLDQLGFYLLAKTVERRQQQEQSAESGMDIASYVEMNNAFKVRGRVSASASPGNLSLPP